MKHCYVFHAVHRMPIVTLYSGQPPFIGSVSLYTHAMLRSDVHTCKTPHYLTVNCWTYRQRLQRLKGFVRT